ncbi:hypothetical protein [Streptomyces sp. NPDC040750]|uniref:hypothetical protein n=1 Tax=unclassified Streptomyces TaxID=2593676 RepID=UPI0033D42828
MSDTSTMEKLSTDSYGSTGSYGSLDAYGSGHGRHRGQVAAQENEAAPHGRHRKPAQERPEAAA